MTCFMPCFRIHNKCYTCSNLPVCMHKARQSHGSIMSNSRVPRNVKISRLPVLPLEVQVIYWSPHFLGTYFSSHLTNEMHNHSLWHQIPLVINFSVFHAVWISFCGIALMIQHVFPWNSDALMDLYLQIKLPLFVYFSDEQTKQIYIKSILYFF